MENAAISTVDAAEVEKFSRLAGEWWDERGKFAPLHRLNPTRISYIKEKVCQAFAKPQNDLKPFNTLSILDIGCGGGLLSEPMARLGAKIKGIDASQRNIEIAKIHAGQMGLDIDYESITAEELAARGEKFDVILNMEVIEHVANVPGFVAACSDLLKPGGVMIVATLNRTVKSYVFAIVGAEYVLRWLPKGTHEWSKFLKPSEIAAHLRQSGLSLEEAKGVAYDMTKARFYLTEDLSVNYMLAVRKR